MSRLAARRRDWPARTAYSILILILGAIAGAAIKEYLLAGFDMWYLVIAATVVGEFVMLLYVRNHLSYDDAEDQTLLDTLKRVEDKLGLTVRYQDTDSLNRAGTGAKDYVTELMANAQEEILIADVNLPTERRDDYYLKEDIRTPYYDTLLKRVQERSIKNVPFVYKRICQFDPPGMSFAELQDPIFLRHCRAMVELQQSQGKRVYLRRTPLAYPIAFKIVDKSHLILHITNVRHKGSKVETYLKGEMIIYDPQKELVKIFLDAWEQLDNAPGTVTVSREELEEQLQPLGAI